mgnify:CR=1 FL=1
MFELVCGGPLPDELVRPVEDVVVQVEVCAVDVAIVVFVVDAAKPVAPSLSSRSPTLFARSLAATAAAVRLAVGRSLLLSWRC